MFFATNAFSGVTRVFPELDELETAVLLLSGDRFMGEDATRWRDFSHMMASAMKSAGEIKIPVAVRDCPDSFQEESSLSNTPASIRTRIENALQYFADRENCAYSIGQVVVLPLKT